MKVTSTPDEVRQKRKVAKAKITRAINERGFSAAEERWFDLIADGTPYMEAAKQAGISKKSAAVRIMTPGFISEVNRRVGAIRAAEGPQNLKVAKAVRDRALDPQASAAQQRVSIEAAKFIEGDTGRPGMVVTVGVQIGPGLIVDLSDDPEPDCPMVDVTPPSTSIASAWSRTAATRRPPSSRPPTSCGPSTSRRTSTAGGS